MRYLLPVVAIFFTWASTAFAQPTSASAECHFREPGKNGLYCRARFEFETFQAGDPTNLRVKCRKEGTDETFRFNGDAELSGSGDFTVIEPKGRKTLPSITIPSDTITCLPPLEKTVDAVLELPSRAFLGATIEGECEVTTVCGH